MKASTVSFLDHEGQKQKNKQKNHKTKNKTKKDVKIQATKNQPNQEASTTSRSRVPTHRSGEHVGRAPCPGERRPRPSGWQRWREAPSRLGQGRMRGEGASVFCAVFLSRPPHSQGSVGPAVEQAAARARRAGRERDLTCVANCARGGDGGLGRARGGAAFHSRGSGFSPCPLTLCCALWAPAPPHAMPPTPMSCKPVRGVCRPLWLSNQQPWGPTPAPRADMVPELWGA